MQEDMEKITLEVPKKWLKDAKKFTGQGTTGAVREGLRYLSQMQAQRDLLSLVGSYKPSISIEEMRSWED